MALCLTEANYGNSEIEATEKTAARYEVKPDVRREVLVKIKKLKKLRFKPLTGKIGRKKDNTGTIIGIILLAIAAIYLGGCGLSLLALGLGAYGLGPSDASVVLLGLLGIFLAFLCVRAIVKSIRKMRQQKNGETEPENIPRHPPTKRKE